jgi:hypothetical protein
MKLAEALARRTDTSRRIDHLRARIADNARFQEGEPPSENAADLLAEAEAALGDLELLIRKINATNSATPLGDGTITDALARRDVLRLRHALITSSANAAAGKNQQSYRQLRSELMYVSALTVRPMRERADTLARELREVDLQIQQANWTTDLID